VDCLERFASKKGQWCLIASESARDVPGMPFQQGTFSPVMIWAPYIANVTLGLPPLLVRLKIPEWFSAAPY
jgi:hypothetical protein